MRLLSPRIIMTGSSLAVQLFANLTMTEVGMWTMEELIQREWVKTMPFLNKGQARIAGDTIRSITQKFQITGILKKITSLKGTIMNAVNPMVDRELIKNHLIPILPKMSRLIGTMPETSTRNMHISDIPKDPTIRKPKTGRW
jgi:hypothetical protein